MFSRTTRASDKINNTYKTPDHVGPGTYSELNSSKLKLSPAPFDISSLKNDFYLKNDNPGKLNNYEFRAWRI